MLDWKVIDENNSSLALILNISPLPLELQEDT